MTAAPRQVRNISQSPMRVALLSLALCLLLATTAAAATYSEAKTLPVPPASTFSGTAGGDGWDLSVGTDRVYNVFHHDGLLRVACLKQANASNCWGGAKTIRDTGGVSFQTGDRSGTFLNETTQKLYAYVYRGTTAGVACVDIAPSFDTNLNPFCGFTSLDSSTSAQPSAPARIGSRWYATHGAKLMCFDTSTGAACSGQPYVLDAGLDTVSATSGPGTVGNKLIIAYRNSGGVEKFTCFDNSTLGDCAGEFPSTITVSTGITNVAPPFPLLDASGTPIGGCIPGSSATPCVGLDGVARATPANLRNTLRSNYYGGASVTIGTRVYLANGDLDSYRGGVQCYDYSTSASCPNFPKTFGGATYYVYTVNADPNRPACLWINSDSGVGQIQSLDAYSGGSCGGGTTRVLTSQFIVPQEKCNPSTYETFRVVSPARTGYTSGTVAFADGSGNAIGSPIALDVNGEVDLSQLGLENANGLPQFIVTLQGATAGELTVELTWTDRYDPDCVGPGTEVEAQPTTVSTLLSDGVQD